MARDYRSAVMDPRKAFKNVGTDPLDVSAGMATAPSDGVRGMFKGIMNGKRPEMDRMARKGVEIGGLTPPDAMRMSGYEGSATGMDTGNTGFTGVGMGTNPTAGAGLASFSGPADAWGGNMTEIGSSSRGFGGPSGSPPGQSGNWSGNSGGPGYGQNYGNGAPAYDPSNPQNYGGGPSNWEYGYSDNKNQYSPYGPGQVESFYTPGQTLGMQTNLGAVGPTMFGADLGRGAWDLGGFADVGRPSMYDGAFGQFNKGGLNFERGISGLLGYAQSPASIGAVPQTGKQPDVWTQNGVINYKGAPPAMYMDDMADKKARNVGGVREIARNVNPGRMAAAEAAMAGPATGGSFAPNSDPYNYGGNGSIGGGFANAGYGTPSYGVNPVTAGNEAMAAGREGFSYGGMNGANAGGTSKIVCTAMNAQYGFGGFRNAIWLAYSRDRLTKAHEVGYHAIFRPLLRVSVGRKSGWRGALWRSLQHIARERTADIRAEMQGGRRRPLGRAYRAILEPLCWAVGKLKGA